MKRLLSLGVVAVVGLTGCKEGVSKAPPTGVVPSNATRDQARQLKIKTPGGQTVTQDTTDDMTVSIDRDNFAGPVTVELRELPKGITVTTKELTIPAGKDSVTVTIQAAPDAAPTDAHKVWAVAKAADMPEAKVDFDLTVKAKK
jgi:folate-dependent tRNA-U54 methylase TrmFO/GidA